MRPGGGLPWLYTAGGLGKLANTASAREAASKALLGKAAAAVAAAAADTLPSTSAEAALLPCVIRALSSSTGCSAYQRNSSRGGTVAASAFASGEAPHSKMHARTRSFCS